MRPISPFLSVYKPQYGSIASIFGRITGLVLFLSLITFLLLNGLVFTLLTDYAVYSLIYLVFFSKNLLVLTILISLIFSLVYHLIFSIRFIHWSFTGGVGNKFDLKLDTLYNYTNASLFLTFILTFLSCLVFF